MFNVIELSWKKRDADVNEKNDVDVNEMTAKEKSSDGQDTYMIKVSWPAQLRKTVKEPWVEYRASLPHFFCCRIVGPRYFIQTVRTMSNPLPRRVSKRPAAVRAGDKIKANLEQVRHWEAKEMEEANLKANLKFAVSKDDLEKTGADTDSMKAMKRKRPDYQDTEDVLEDSDDDLPTQSSNSMASTTLCASTSGESDPDPSIDSNIFELY